MKPKEIMLIAGEPSGDTLAAELVTALRPVLAAANTTRHADLQPLRTPLEPRFFGAGGPAMQAAGVDVAFDLTKHSVVGLDFVRHYPRYHAMLNELFRLALKRQPDIIVCVDFQLFNRRFARLIRQYTRRKRDWFHDWQPKIVQYVSPQVWASRSGRVYEVAKDCDLLLSIFPFEKAWYARRVPGFNVEYVGHPLVDRFGGSAPALARIDAPTERPPELLLLPGSRAGEVKRHVPVMLDALKILRRSEPDLRARIVLPNEQLAKKATALGANAGATIQIGGLSQALENATVAIASSGTVTMECAWFGVPTVTLYKAFWVSFRLAKMIAKVKWITMPNLLLDREVFPEYLQGAATPGNLARAALELLKNQSRRTQVKEALADIVRGLGAPGASRRAAEAIVRLPG